METVAAIKLMASLTASIVLAGMIVTGYYDDPKKYKSKRRNSCIHKSV